MTSLTEGVDLVDDVVRNVERVRDHAGIVQRLADRSTCLPQWSGSPAASREK
jgi:hypothetical protein